MKISYTSRGEVLFDSRSYTQNGWSEIGTKELSHTKQEKQIKLFQNFEFVFSVLKISDEGAYTNIHIYNGTVLRSHCVMCKDCVIFELNEDCNLNARVPN